MSIDAGLAANNLARQLVQLLLRKNVLAIGVEVVSVGVLLDDRLALNTSAEARTATVGGSVGLHTTAGGYSGGRRGSLLVQILRNWHLRIDSRVGLLGMSVRMAGLRVVARSTCRTRCGSGAVLCCVSLRVDRRR